LVYGRSKENVYILYITVIYYYIYKYINKYI